MKQSPQDENLLSRLAAGILSGEGFIGNDDRDLSEILDADNSTVEAMGLSHVRIAEALDKICHQAMENQGRPVNISRDLEAVYHDAMGPIPCPWGHGKLFAKGEIELKQLSTGKVLYFTPLSAHLIGEHGFYQGQGSKYRLDPKTLADLLGLV